MGERYLTILEVSQKQAFIFQSNELKKNILNSAVIAWIMDAEYLEKAAGDPKLFCKKDHLVYSGGGHTVLEFPAYEQAVRFNQTITKRVKKEYPGIDIFAKTMKYADDKSPADNLKELTKVLEKKKSERRSAFHQGSFGVEQIDTNTLNPLLCDSEKVEKMPEKEKEIDEALMPDGFKPVFKFEELGGTKDKSNFVAVVHIDGNAMGKRVEKLQSRFRGLDWEAYKKNLREFSESIDKDFKEAYKEMSLYVADCIQNGRLAQLNIEGNKFPVRRVITAGDDICFVTEGRIGLECAAAFIHKLGGKKNAVDGEEYEGYAACAGVAIVHQKYPFYKAYELAEMLCSNAKRYGASLSSDKSGSDVSAIDWHIEFGEMKDTLDQIRKDYLDADGESISGRPYIVRAAQPVISEYSPYEYQMISGLVQKLQNDDSCARGTMKELRSVLKQGKEETEHFIKFHKIEQLLKRDLSNNYQMLYDAIELIDTFIALEDKEGKQIED